MSSGAGNTIALKSLSNGIRDLIAPCFGIDLLQLERVTWSSPGNLLQKISEGEAVHQIRSWPDLKRRLGPYRRCFILSHPALPLQPLTILHVALTAEISSSIHSIISRTLSQSESEIAVMENTNQVTTAIFYSISSTQKGLTVNHSLHNESQIFYSLFCVFCFIGHRSWSVSHQTSRAPTAIGNSLTSTVFDALARAGISFVVTTSAS